MDQLEVLPIDIILAKLKNPLISDAHKKQVLEAQRDKISTVINYNFELLADKYKLLLGAMPGCSPDLIVEEFKKCITQVEQGIATYMDHLRRILGDLQKFQEYDQNVLRERLSHVTQLISKTFQVVDNDMTDVEAKFLIETYTDPESALQNQVLNLILERNQHLENVMNKVYSEQVEYTGMFKSTFELLGTTNHFEPLNRLLASQKQFWNTRTRSVVNLSNRLMEDVQQSQIMQSSIIVNNQSNQNQTLIDAMLKLRGHTHDMMVEHKKEISKTKIGNHARLDGGGTFGYCWTGGYGWRGLHYEYLGLSNECNECRTLNQDMHQTAKKLFELEYRDKGTWWVQAWFMYQK